jgi:hypothetical protein
MTNLQNAALLNERLLGKWNRLQRLQEHCTDNSQETCRSVPENQPPSFEEWSGLDEMRICTRVERQIGGGRIPYAFDRLGKLTQIEGFNPFSTMVIDPGGSEIPKRADYHLNDWMAGLHYRRMIQEDGYDAASRWLRKQAGPHAARALEQYKPFVPCLGVGITSEALYAKFRESVRGQLCPSETQTGSEAKLNSFPAALSGKILPKKECEIDT